MRQVLRLLGTRFGAALVLVVLIAIVVAIGRLLGGGNHTGFTTGPAPDVTAEATTSPEPDDGDAIPSESPLPPPTSPGAPPAQAVALDFANAWLHHTGVTPAQWFQGLSKYATKNLQDKLNGVDPAGVPANQTTGDPTLVDQEGSYANVAIPLDAGTLSLRLIVEHGHWLVDGVDWQRG
jgi:hypothetical protein